MKNKFTSSLMVCLLVVVASNLYAGGGWSQGRGHGFAKLSESWIVSNQHFTDQGLIDPNLTTSIYTTALYGEIGLSDRLTAIAYVPFFSRALYNNQISKVTGETLIQGDAINTFGDADISLKFGLVQNKPTVLSATLLLGLPLGETAGGAEGILQTGDGEFNQMLQLDLSRGFKLGNTNAYASAYAAFNNRTKGFSDEVRFGIETGAGFFQDKLYAILRLQGIKSTFNGDGNVVSDGATLFANNTEYMAFNPEIAYNITPKFGVSAGFGGVFYGRLIYANPSFNVGAYLKW